ncbi:MAG: hypothetical protein RDA78_08710 [Roseibium sp.]|uniref:hypothetical protein n=1 Tax=Roseibium sp. TaxID=1936156 RepID=UPI003D9C1A3E
MTDFLVKPETFQAALDQASAGDKVQLTPGTYDGVYTISRRRGTEDRPIVIEPALGVDPGACKISQGVSADTFRPISNRLAKYALEIGYDFPGLYPWIDDASLRIYRCQHVIVRNLVFSKAWPTHIFIESAADISIQNCAFEDATFCIGALGAVTRDILIEHCTWTQDTVPDRLWHRIPWFRVHGETVDEEKDYRLFDGDFFRSNEIAGGVTIRHCSIRSAFNAIHGYNTSAEARLNRDFHIHHNRFEQIRDNVFEPEDGASNWWFHHNDMIDVHKWFSIECVTRGPIYIFSNTGSFRTQQGSDPFAGDEDENNGGAVFKPIKKVERAKGPFNGLYVFHNSFITRSSYIKKGLLPGLSHKNNAIAYAAAKTDTPRTNGFFGKVHQPEYDKRFTSSWSRWNIDFDGDVVGFPSFADEVLAARYPLGDHTIDEGPDFSGAGHALEEFELGPNSLGRGSSISFRVLLPSGHWASPGGLNVGALQGEPGSPSSNRFEGPAFQPTLGERHYDTFVGV